MTDQRMGFVGVTTGSSSIMRIFPAWADELGLPTRTLEGHDLPLDAPRERYRDLIEAMRADENYLGALVTTHKIGVYDAAGDLFDEVDSFGRLCGEISSISKRGERLLGHAKDPITADLAMREFLPQGWFAGQGAARQALCLGAGGAGAAITWCLATRDDPPATIITTDISQERLDHLRQVHADGGLDPEMFDYVLVAGPADDQVARLSEGSLVINATGLGKDRPGSPLTENAPYPAQGYLWELNYRGSLDFMHHAQAAADDRGLTVVDGWRYFVHGWTQVIAEVFDIEMTPSRVQRLSEIATQVTGGR